MEDKSTRGSRIVSALAEMQAKQKTLTCHLNKTTTILREACTVMGDETLQDDRENALCQVMKALMAVQGLIEAYMNDSDSIMDLMNEVQCDMFDNKFASDQNESP